MKRIVCVFCKKPFKPYIKKKIVEGVSFDFWIGDRVGQIWYDVQSTDPVWAEMRFIKEHLIQEGDVVLECGGHHGCTAIILSNWVGISGKIVSFEPSPDNGNIIDKNICLNGLKNVTLVRKAIGAERKTTTISLASNASVSLKGDGVKVEQICLDEYAYLNPTFVKIDVEGFEMQVLQGAQKILATRPKLAIEIHSENLPEYGASVADLLRLIHIENYKLWIQWDDVKQPEEYDMKTPIEKRVHLFCIPIKNNPPNDRRP